MKKKFIIIFSIVIVLLLAGIITFAILFFVEKNKNTKPDDVERLKKVLVKKGYKPVTKTYYKNQYLDTAYYAYDFKKKEYQYHMTYMLGDTEYSVLRKYDLVMDVATQNVSGLRQNMIVDVYEDDYYFKSGNGKCRNGCGYLIEFKKEFLRLLDKNDIDIKNLE